MKNLGGHNFSYTRAVERSLQNRGCEVTVFTNKHLSADLVSSHGYRPIFSCGAYDFPPGNGKWRDLEYLHAQSVVFSDELEQSLKQYPRDHFGVVFCHTVNDFELIGWRRFLSRNGMGGHLMILMRQTPGFGRCSRWKPWIHPYWRIKPRNLSAIRSLLNGRFVLLTDSEPLSRDYRHIFNHRIVTMPIPINEYFLNDRITATADANGTERDESLAIGYMGDARPAKGFGMLPRLIERTLAKTNLNVRFVIQCPPPASGTADVEQNPDVRDLLELSKRCNGSLKLVRKRLSETEYADLFSSLDAVLIPYTGPYIEATSGIFAEAVALSKPVLVPGGTWMSEQLRSHGGGLEFRKGDIGDLAVKLEELVKNFGEHSERAKVSSASWKAFHNSDTLANLLIQEAGLRPSISVGEAALVQGIR